jgi:hypothetical protein
VGSSLKSVDTALELISLTFSFSLLFHYTPHSCHEINYHIEILAYQACDVGLPGSAVHFLQLYSKFIQYTTSVFLLRPVTYIIDSILKIIY